MLRQGEYPRLPRHVDLSEPATIERAADEEGEHVAERGARASGCGRGRRVARAELAHSRLVSDVVPAGAHGGLLLGGLASVRAPRPRVERPRPMRPGASAGRHDPAVERASWTVGGVMRGPRAHLGVEDHGLASRRNNRVVARAADGLVVAAAEGTDHPHAMTRRRGPSKLPAKYVRGTRVVWLVEARASAQIRRERLERDERATVIDGGVATPA